MLVRQRPAAALLAEAVHVLLDGQDVRLLEDVPLAVREDVLEGARADHLLHQATSASRSASRLCRNGITETPSPVAPATPQVAPFRTSPTANTPRMLVS